MSFHPVALISITAFVLFMGGRVATGDEFATEVQRRLASGGGIRPAEDAAGAVDGRISGTFGFHTGQDNPPWWQVDLGESKQIAVVRIFAPHLGSRLNEFSLLLSDDGENWRLARQHGKTSDSDRQFEIPLTDARGRFLRVAASGTTYMHLDEVQVFVPGDPTTNVALRCPCLQSSASQWSTRSIQLEPPGDWRTNLLTGRRVIDEILSRMAECDDLARRRDALMVDHVALDDPRWESLYQEALERGRKWIDIRQQFELIDLAALGRALDDLALDHPELYPDRDDLKSQLAAQAVSLDSVRAALATGQPDAWAQAAELVALQRQILLRNPLLDFDRMVILRRRLGGGARSAMGAALGVGTLNAHTNDSLRRTGWDNEIALLTGHRERPSVDVLHNTEGRLITDLEVDFDASRIMFSSIGLTQPNWRLFEIDVPAKDAPAAEARQVTPDDGDDVGHFDSCYLADPAEIIFCSTASYQGLPCEYGSRRMTCLFKMNRRTGQIRQLTFEQDSDWCPAPLANGRVLYQRWEYCDLPHSNSRILFQMNPDGTGQMEYYGSGSYFMPSYFYARPIPGHDTQVVGIATGHHGIPRSGRLIIIDPMLGRREAQGVVQEIPGRGKTVEPEVYDRLVDWSWPHFLHPYPLNTKHFLVAMKPHSNALWGIYLVDVFDNMTLLYQEEGAAVLDPIPLVEQRRPPVLADKTIPGEKNATVFLADIHQGDGLKDVPRGAIKRLRVGTYYFSSYGTGGLLGSIGADGPWDIKRVLGTTPVEEDGSACFTIPANTPIFIQPLDDEGKAVQLMRSWMVGMPGEIVSCVGCHESQNSVVPSRRTLASLRPPTPIDNDSSSVRGFSFPHEVQPILDRYCVGCHDGSSPSNLPRIAGITYPESITRDQDNGEGLVDLRGTEYITDWSSQHAGNCGDGARGGNFPISYVALERYVRRNGIEGPLDMLSPGEFHADTTELVQMLRHGRHYNVQLDAESWQTLITWIDLNAPCHGTWTAIGAAPAAQVASINDRRMELAKAYANIDVNLEEQEPLPPPVTFKPPQPREEPNQSAEEAAHWPFSMAEAAERQGASARRTIDLGRGITMEFARIPAGEYINAAGRRVIIAQPFWMACFETTNEQMRCFDPAFNSRREDRYGYQFGRLGYGMNGDEMAAVRVDWNTAVAFCRWLSERTGHVVSLPCEQEWEWACRAGSAGDFWFGNLGDDFTPFANLGDVRLIEYAANTNTNNYTTTSLIANPNKYDDRVPRDREFDDGHFLTIRYPRDETGVMLATPDYQAERPAGYEGLAQRAAFKPNPWGLYDMHGNVWEWTTTETPEGRKLACGGSFHDRPKRCVAGSRVDYRPYHKIFNVGFRVILREDME